MLIARLIRNQQLATAIFVLMCGIVGYIGEEKALPILLDGLKALEYRGYDSSGISVVGGGGVVSEKSVGRIKMLEEKIGDGERFGGTVGISHTRWATHGQVTDANAHPHSDCHGKTWVVHNGIIENYKGLRQELERSGHSFRSETDTEVIPHLIEEVRSKNQKLSFEEAVRLVLQKIQGTYGLAIVSQDDPDKLLAARNFSPLVLGVGENEYIVASDASAVLRRTKNVIYLDDGEIAVLTTQGHKVYDLSRNIQHKEVSEIEWSLEQAEKSGYPHFMLKEIFEGPDALQNVIRGRLVPDEGLAKLGGLEDFEEKLRSAERIIITACGTARFAGLCGEYALEEYGGVPTEVEYASEIRYRKPVVDPEKTVLIAISQSGETADTIAAIHELKRKGVLTLGVVNVVGSTIAREVDAGIYTHSGPELAVASTKAFIGQMGALVLLTLFMGRERELSLVLGKRIVEELMALPAKMRKTLKLNELIRKLAEKYKGCKNFLYLGRKYNYPIALEGDIKLKEISYVHSEGYPAGEMKHGPIAMIDESFPSIFIAPQDSVYEKVTSNMEEVKARKGPVIAIATEGDIEIASVADDVIYIPKTLELLTPFLSVIPLQLFAYHMAVLLGRDVDRPRNLAKSVTVE